MREAPSLFDMATAVARAAKDQSEIVQGIDAGKIIGPSPMDIRLGAIDPRKQAHRLTAAADMLLAMAVASGNGRKDVA